MKRPSFEDIARQHPLREQLRCDGVKVSNGNFLCPFHPDKRPSAYLIANGRKAECQDDECMQGGKKRIFDSIDYIARTRGCDRDAAIKILSGYEPMKHQPRPEGQEREFRFGPIPEDRIPREGRVFKYFSKTGSNREVFPEIGIWIYRDAQGDAQAIILRAKDRDDGSKDIRQIAWDTITNTFRGSQIPKPPLYGADQLEKHQDKRVLVVEGEKCVSYLQLYLEDEWVVVTWMGGAGRAKDRDFSALDGRDVTWWPDADRVEPDKQLGKGEVAMLTALERCSPRRSRWIEPLQSWREIKGGYDCVDLLEREGIVAVKNALRELPTEVRQQAPEPAAQGATSRPDSWLPEGQMLITTKDDGGIKGTSQANHILYLRHHPDFRGRFVWDVFDRKVLIDGRPITDALMMDVLIQLCSLPAKLDTKLDPLANIVVGIAMANPVNRLGDKLRSMKGTWDKKSRYLLDYAGVDETVWSKTVSRRWGLGLVNRIMNPGCKHDGMLVIEGAEAIGKSTFVATLASAIDGRDLLLTTTTLRLDTNNAMQLDGKAIVELAEMTAHRKAEADAFKAMISNQTDSYRKPYARNFIDVPRTCVFTATTNKLEGYLTDPTGNRRVWPVRMVRHPDLDRFKSDVPQILAELVERVLDGEDGQMSAHERADQKQEVVLREQEDPWEETLAKITEVKITTAEVFHTYLNVPIKDRTRTFSIRLADAMRRLGWKSDVRNRTRYWVRS